MKFSPLELLLGELHPR